MNTSDGDSTQTRKAMLVVNQYIDSLEGDVSAEEQSKYFMICIETLGSINRAVAYEAVHRLYVSTLSKAVLLHADTILYSETQQHFLSLANMCAEHIRVALRAPHDVALQQLAEKAQSMYDHCYRVADATGRRRRDTNSLTVTLYLRAARLHSLEKTLTS